MSVGSSVADSLSSPITLCWDKSGARLLHTWPAHDMLCNMINRLKL